MRAGALIEWGLASQSRRIGQESGDLHVIQAYTDGTLVGVMDGLGHGPEAALVSRLCRDVLTGHVGEALDEVVRKCHERLLGTRGVTLSVASFNDRDRTWTWLGVGNVAGVLLRPAGAPPRHREFLLTRNGVLGARLPRLSAATLPAALGDTMIMATDGVRTDFAQELDLTGTPQQVAERILASHSTGSDDALVFVARYIEEDREPYQS